MGGLLNRIRRFVDAEGRPTVLGFHAVGDAHTCTNPAYGRGQSLALKMATMIADAVAGHDHLQDAAREYEAACVEQIVPWYQFSVLTDQMRVAAGVRPGSGPSTADPLTAIFGGGGTDPETASSGMKNMTVAACWPSFPPPRRRSHGGPIVSTSSTPESGNTSPINGGTAPGTPKRTSAAS